MRCTLAALFLVALSAGAFAQASKPRVAVFGFSNETAQKSLDAASGAATDSLTLTLKELGIYEVVRASGYDGERTDSALRDWAEAQRADFIAFGKLKGSEGGEVTCELSIFDRSKGRVSVSESADPCSILEIFDSSDQLIIKVLEALSGKHIGFGRLELTNTGIAGSWEVRIDGIPMGRDIQTLDRVLIGKRRIGIYQNRMFGEAEVFKADVDIREGELTALRFAIPDRLPEEEKAIGSLDTIADNLAQGAAAGDLDAEIARYRKLLSDVSYNPQLKAAQEELDRLEIRWTIRKNRLAIETAAWSPTLALLDSVVPFYNRTQGFKDDEMAKAAFLDNCRLLATLFELRAGAALAQNDIGGVAQALRDAAALAPWLPRVQNSFYSYASLAAIMVQNSDAPPEAKRAQLEKLLGRRVEQGQKLADLREKFERKPDLVIMISSDWDEGVDSTQNSAQKKDADRIQFKDRGLQRFGNLELKGDIGGLLEGTAPAAKPGPALPDRRRLIADLGLGLVSDNPAGSSAWETTDFGLALNADLSVRLFGPLYLDCGLLADTSKATLVYPAADIALPQFLYGFRLGDPALGFSLTTQISILSSTDTQEITVTPIVGLGYHHISVSALAGMNTGDTSAPVYCGCLAGFIF